MDISGYTETPNSRPSIVEATEANRGELVRHFGARLRTAFLRKLGLEVGSKPFR
ncbi:hypothetical protein PENSUB_11991 [Penicillium subrubescens]|uniref:Uncharacterized protein n=1 Tax=Penicillium subrubescens TaxID=1316194 RepID=A0A1Q5T0K5_9EURO|nr:hypothetical protein PENSUB_11991 [Penicillium subrubescens]